MSEKSYISVILPLKLEWEPCYALNSESENKGYEAQEEINVELGTRVRVRFANKEYIGVVSAVDVQPEIELSKVLPIIGKEEMLERVLPQEIELWRTIAKYYLCSVGEVYKVAYPYGKVNLEEARAAAKSKVHQRRERMADSIRSRIDKLEARLEKKKALLKKARKESTKNTYSEEINELVTEISHAKAALEAMTAKSDTEAAPQILAENDICLSDAQKNAYREIKEAFVNGKPALLNGVTGSGKTEIYMKLAAETLAEGGNVLYLVPEIALCRQLEDRLYEYFGESLLIFHSGESAAVRRNTAEAMRNPGSNYIVLGTRSAIFLPHHKLRLIIVDEEHDNSYKQESPAPRYNGRDTALMLSQIQNSNIILGSATPSLEELYNCQIGKHQMVELKERYYNSQETDVEIIDTKAERRKNGMKGNFSIKLIQHIQKTLDKGEQVVILRSRRAWAPMMQCGSCGEIVKCPHCNVSLSYHKDGRMICHYCGHTETYTCICKKCGGILQSLGSGTQKIEEEAASLFPGADIARLDSDTAQSRNYEIKTIRAFSKGEIDILIGTQIVTKGFDFKNLTLVAVIAADSLLAVQDFRADEKAAQLLEQFKGRCGRRERKGLFIIQTSQAEHPVYQKIAKRETLSISSSLLQERMEFNFPPYSRIIEICIKDIYEDRAERMAWKLANELRMHFDKGSAILNSPVTGPYIPVIDKIADNYIRNIRLSLKKDRSLAPSKEVLRKIVKNFEKTQKYDSHITLNVDPS